MFTFHIILVLYLGYEAKNIQIDDRKHHSISGQPSRFLTYGESMASDSESGDSDKEVILMLL